MAREKPNQRETKWLNAEEAVNLVEEGGFAEIIDRLSGFHARFIVFRKSWKDPLQTAETSTDNERYPIGDPPKQERRNYDTGSVRQELSRDSSTIPSFFLPWFQCHRTGLQVTAHRPW
jgi:hypothetical protein